MAKLGGRVGAERSRSIWSPVSSSFWSWIYSSGLPLLLTLTTLSYWSTVGVDKTMIGIFLFVQTPYIFKFLWSPIMTTRSVCPFLVSARAAPIWLFVTQILLAEHFHHGADRSDVAER